MATATYQEYLLSALVEAADRQGVMALIHKEYANTGQIIAGTPFTQRAVLSYDIQPTKVSIRFNGAPSGTRDMSFYFDITDTQTASRMLVRWSDLITEGIEK